jgi:hypothetical protein
MAAGSALRIRGMASLDSRTSHEPRRAARRRNSNQRSEGLCVAPPKTPPRQPLGDEAKAAQRQMNEGRFKYKEYNVK